MTTGVSLKSEITISDLKPSQKRFEFDMHKEIMNLINY